MKDIGFRKLRSEPCVYVFEREGDWIIVPSYVDDIHILGKHAESIAKIKQELGQHFKFRDLGPTKWFLGIHITRDRLNRTLSFSQRQYCKDMLKEFNMLEANPVSTPMTPGTHLSAAPSPLPAEDTKYMKDKPYLWAVGKLNYLALATRPDILGLPSYRHELLDPLLSQNTLQESQQPGKWPSFDTYLRILATKWNSLNPYAWTTNLPLLFQRIQSTKGQMH
jgi:hypothetical protein